MPRAILDRQMELRKVGEGDLFQVITALDAYEDWARVMSHVPLDPRCIDQENYERKYNYDHIRIIEKHAKSTGRKPTEIFLDEWRTSGRVRPTLETLQKLVEKLQLYRAMFEIARLVGDNEPPRPQGPAEKVDTEILELLNQEQLEIELKDMDSIAFDQLANEETYNKNIDGLNNGPKSSPKEFPNFIEPTVPLSAINMVEMIEFSLKQPIEVVSTDLPLMLKQHSITPTLPDVPHLQVQPDTSSENEQSTQDSSDMPLAVSSINRSSEENKLLGLNFKYEDLKKITRSFASTSDVSKGMGGKIGKGGFGEVYVGFTSDLRPIAVKRLLSKDMERKTLLKQFQAEVEMSYFRHVNVVQVYGYSIDGPENLIVSEFVQGGNLRQKLNHKVLDETQRFRIILGTAKGLQYLHYGTEKRLIHKDVKSLNILLTEDCIPKLCDFGLTRMQDTMTTKLMGTDAYVAPEVFQWDITPKMDVYSYGVVLLEILTGLQPVIKTSNAESRNIESFVKDELRRIGNVNDIRPLLESIISNWPIANDLYYLATKCLSERTIRFDSSEVCAFLQSKMY